MLTLTSNSKILERIITDDNDHSPQNVITTLRFFTNEKQLPSLICICHSTIYHTQVEISHTKVLKNFFPHNPTY